MLSWRAPTNATPTLTEMVDCRVETSVTSNYKNTLGLGFAYYFCEQGI